MGSNRWPSGTKPLNPGLLGRCLKHKGPFSEAASVARRLPNKISEQGVNRDFVSVWKAATELGKAGQVATVGGEFFEVEFVLDVTSNISLVQAEAIPVEGRNPRVRLEHVSTCIAQSKQNGPDIYLELRCG
jgi:hypothetical protein